VVANHRPVLLFFGSHRTWRMNTLTTLLYRKIAQYPILPKSGLDQVKLNVAELVEQAASWNPGTRAVPMRGLFGIDYSVV
jgi:hypothetical protein